MQPAIMIAIVVIYVLVMLAIGYVSMRKTKTVGDFFLGGRTLGPWMSAFAFGTTYFSAVLFIGYAGKFGWGFGIHTMWIVLGNAIVGTLLSWWVLAARTRDMTVRLNALTMPEFLRTRYNSKALQIFAALCVFAFLVPYSASVYKGLGFLFQFALHMDYNSALIFLALLTGIYLVMGGYFAVAISDFIRGIVEFIGVLVMVLLLANHFGGFGATTETLLGDPKVYAPAVVNAVPLGAKAIIAIPGLNMIAPGVLVLVCLVVITSFGPWSLPQMVQKFYSIRSKADVTRAMIIATVFALFMAFGAYYSGALTHLYYPGGLPAAIMEHGGPNFDKLMPNFLTDPQTGIPLTLVLVIMLMVFSASMSSLSSLVLVSSSAIAIDIYGAFVKRETKQQETMTLMRVLCAVFVGLSLVIAVMPNTFIVSLMILSWASLAAVFLGPFVYGLFWRRTTLAGVCAGIASGLIPMILLYLAWGEPGIPVAGTVAMVLPMIVIPIVSLLTAPPPKALLDKAFGTEEACEGE
jgi:solute:Na+ symporter, SSS family